MRVVFRPSLSALLSADKSVVDSDMHFVRLHYAIDDGQSMTGDCVTVTDIESMDGDEKEIDEQGKATARFGKVILVYRNSSKGEFMGEAITQHVSVVYSLRQLYTKLVLNDCILEKPSLLQTTILKIGYDGDTDMIDSMICTNSMFQDSYPYYYIKTDDRMRPSVDYQLTFKSTAGINIDDSRLYEERCVVCMSAVSGCVHVLEGGGGEELRVEWPGVGYGEENFRDGSGEEGSVRIVMRKKHREPMEWIRVEEFVQEKSEQEPKFEFEPLVVQLPEKTSYVHEVFFLFGKSHLLLRKTDFKGEGKKGWQKLDGQYMHKLEQKRALDEKPITVEALNRLSQELSKKSGSQMFFYSYSKIVKDPVVKMLSFESLPLYPRIPKLNLALEEYLNKKLSKK